MIPQEQFIISELGLTSLPLEEQQEITTAIRSHMQDVLIETTILNLADDDVIKLKSELNSPEFSEDAIMRITAGVPNLREKMQTALTTEWDVIKSTYDKIK